MKRKIIKIAEKTFVITLPLQWLSLYKLKKGDEIELSVNNNQLTISALSNESKESISFSIENLDEQTIRWLLSAMHKYGYDEIELFYKGKEQVTLVKELLKDLFTGFAIIEQSEKRILITAISNDTINQFDQVLRRAFRITIAMAEQVSQSLSKNDFVSLEEAKSFEKNNNQLTNFCERLLNKKQGVNSRKSNFLYVVIWNLEKIADNYKYLCDYCIKNKLTIEITSKSIELLNEINQFFKEYYELYFNFSLEKLNDLAKQKNYLSTKIKSFQIETANEQYFLIICSQILIQTADFSASFIAINN